MGALDTVTKPIHLFFKAVGLVLLVGGSIGAGFLERSPTVIVALAIAWFSARVGTAWRSWRNASRASGGGTGWALVGTSAAIAAGLSAVLYGLGRWLGTMSDIEMPAESFGGFDWFLFAFLMVIAVPLRVFGGTAVMEAADIVLDA